jgi:hypothetical protein
MTATSSDEDDVVVSAPDVAQLRENNRCKLCCERLDPDTAVMLPCGCAHSFFCRSCATRAFQRKPECCFCRAVIPSLESIRPLPLVMRNMLNMLRGARLFCRKCDTYIPYGETRKTHVCVSSSSSPSTGQPGAAAAAAAAAARCGNVRAPTCASTQEDPRAARDCTCGSTGACAAASGSEGCGEEGGERSARCTQRAGAQERHRTTRGCSGSGGGCGCTCARSCARSRSLAAQPRSGCGRGCGPVAQGADVGILGAGRGRCPRRVRDGV